MSPWADDGQVVVENWFKILVFYVLLVTSVHRREGAAPTGRRVPVRHGRVHAALAPRVRRRAVHVPHGHRPHDRRRQLARRPEQFRGEHRVRPAVRPGLLAVGPRSGGPGRPLLRLRGSVGRLHPAHRLAVIAARAARLGCVRHPAQPVPLVGHLGRGGRGPAAFPGPARVAANAVRDDRQSRGRARECPRLRRGADGGADQGHGADRGVPRDRASAPARGGRRPAASSSRTTCTASCAARWACSACWPSGRSSFALR